MPIYGIKNKADILVNVLNALQKNAGVSAIYPGSIARAFAEAFTSEVSDLYEALRFNITQGDLMTASGRNLDLIGDLYGITRRNISDYSSQDRQSFNIQFFIDKPHSSDVTVPSGTLVYNDVSNFITKQYTYKLVGDVIIGTGSTRAYGRVEPNFTDNAYVAPVSTLTKHNAFAPAGVILFCTNPKEVYSNTGAESDTNFRRRIIASMKAKSPGTVESVRFAALAVKGVRDVRIREGTYGVGSCDVIVVPETASDMANLPQRVMIAVNSVKPIGVRFNVRVAERVSIGLDITVSLSMGVSSNLASGIRNQASLFVKRYLNSLTIGDVISIAEIERQVKASSDYIKACYIKSMSADGTELALVDFSLDTVKKYPVAGGINVDSVIMGASNY